ncbi:Maf family protein [Glaciecola sp. 1036]|uniref:Maf family protein n=1 Tax=Alteromonadaceae TaxID=72275 RepID=UPI003D026CC5
MSRKIILGSSSSYRASLLKQLGVEFEQHSPDIDESKLEGETPREMATRLSTHKALKLQPLYPNHIIITSDQVAYIADKKKFLSKPGTIDNAIEQLTLCSGAFVDFYTGLCILPSNLPEEMRVEVVKYRVKFRSLSQQEIKGYVKKEKPLNCAGSFMVENLGIHLFESMEGNDYNALIGLPLIALSKHLRDFGINPLL